MKSTNINDLQVGYTETGSADGSGLPVVFIHGLAEASDSWANVQAQLGNLHTYAYDLRGHGSTSIGTAAGTLEQLGEDLIGFLETVSGPAIVVGFSLGGTIALWAAASRPDLVAETVVMGTSSVVGRQAVDFYAGRIALASNTASDEFRDAVRADTAAGLHRAHDKLDAITETRLAAIGQGAGYINASRAMAAMRENPLTPTLTRINAHVHVIGAAFDAFCPSKAAQIILDNLPNATYHEVPEAGHLMSVDNAAEVSELLGTIAAELNTIHS